MNGPEEGGGVPLPLYAASRSGRTLASKEGLGPQLQSVCASAAVPRNEHKSFCDFTGGPHIPLEETLVRVRSR